MTPSATSARASHPRPATAPVRRRLCDDTNALGAVVIERIRIRVIAERRVVEVAHPLGAKRCIAAHEDQLLLARQPAYLIGCEKPPRMLSRRPRRAQLALAR